jgi:UDP-3-O-acyl-N-acetylglucosamine deacetylase
MMNSFTRKTVANDVFLEGLGLHSGIPVRVAIRPGAKGIAFRLGAERVEAKPENVTDTTRCTTLGPVGTIEHLMSAFAGLEITDAEIELDAPELPGLDGSAGPYVEAILGIGTADIGEAEIPSLYKRVFLQDDKIKVAVSKGEGLWRYSYLTDSRWPGEQSFEMQIDAPTYASHVAPARTFVLAEEIPMIIQHGLGRGLDENTALILGIDGYKNESRFDDEPSRHKLLDLMGDLYLSGVPIKFLNVVAERSGHRSNVQAAALLAHSIHS